MFVLLDLIGHKDIQFVNFFDQMTGKYFNRLRDIGLFLRMFNASKDNDWLIDLETGLLRAYATNNQNTHKRPVFSAHVGYGRIEDDHVPFLNYGNWEI